jgi:hypothetical protein
LPHDKHGNPVNVGDVVSIRCKVKSVYVTNDYCNLSLEAEELMPPDNTRSAITLNTRQVELVAADSLAEVPTGV